MTSVKKLEVGLWVELDFPSSGGLFKGIIVQTTPEIRVLAFFPEKDAKNPKFEGRVTKDKILYCLLYVKRSEIKRTLKPLEIPE